MESHLKIRMMTDEIENCKDVEQLQTNLKAVSTLLLRYQHILNCVMERVMEQEISRMLGMPIEKNVK